MEMKTTDFNHIEPHQAAIHERLLNWSRWVSVRPHSRVHPMFAKYRPAQHWDPKEMREACDTLDAQALEKVIGGLPPDHAFALRWCYVWRMSVGDARRAIGVSTEGLHRYLRDGRQFVINRLDRANHENSRRINSH
jgi:DNA-directed RNA polymerase specialized sigma24 family protein